MRFSFHPEAQEEFRLAIDYYEVRETTLAYQFAAEVYAAMERTSEHPNMWPFIEEGIRRCLVGRFPYGVICHHDESGNELVILAVMHLHREPYYWAHRK